MSSTFLQLVDSVFYELGLAAPSIVAASTDPQVIQVRNLMNKVGNELVTEHEWQRLNKEYRFTTTVVSLTGTTTSGSAVVTGLSSTASLAADTFAVTGNGVPSDTYISTVDSGTQITMTQNATATGSQSLTFTKVKYSLPSDYDRLVDRTDWDKTNHWELIGPKTGQEWQYLKGGIIATGPRVRFRVLQNVFQLYPPPTTSAYMGYEYISNQWVVAVDGTTYKTSFTVDTDTSLFRDRVLISGTKYEFFSQKGLDTTQLSADYQAELSKQKALDKGAPILSMSPRITNIYIGPESIPDSNYGH